MCIFRVYKTFSLRIIILIIKKWKWKSFSHVRLFAIPDYTAHGILQARILEWVAFSFSRGSFQPKDWIPVSHIAGGFFTTWATREAYSYNFYYSSISSLSNNKHIDIFLRCLHSIYLRQNHFKKAVKQLSWETFQILLFFLEFYSCLHTYSGNTSLSKFSWVFPKQSLKLSYDFLSNSINLHIYHLI